MGQMKTLTINGTKFNVIAPTPVDSVNLLARGWVGTESPYSQRVTRPGVTASTKVDLLPSVEQLAIFHDKDLGFVAENEGGIITVYAVGDKPKNDYTIQVATAEVKDAPSKVIGVTVGTTLSPDKIREKINPVMSVNGVVPDEHGNVEAGVNAGELRTAVDEALQDAKDSGLFEGKDGKDGTSVTVANVSESTADGGNNIVTFSDGKSVTIKNGSKGTPGEAGFSPTISTSAITGGTRITIIDKNGTKTVDVLHGKDGVGGGDGSGSSGVAGVGISSVVLNADYTLTLNFTDGNSYTTPSIRGAAGEPGSDGVDGKDGTSVTVANVSESSADGGSNVITFSDGKTITIKNGSAGKDGSNGSNGSDGVSATHSWNGTTLTITSASGTSSVNLKGDKGEKGDSVKGDKGDPGSNGVSATHSWSGTTLTVTSASGTSSANLKGEKGDKGDSVKGDPGANATINGVTALTIKNGTGITGSQSGSTYTIGLDSHNQAASTITAGTFAGQVVANSSGQTYSTMLLRNSKLVSSDTNPSTNGEICWTYG